DFVVETDDFATLSADLPALCEDLDPLAQQWDRLSSRMCWMMLLPGPVKVDLIFPDERHQQEPPWHLSMETLPWMDAHFWDWILWLRAKTAHGADGLVRAELIRLHEHLLSPLGVRTAPASTNEAVAVYRAGRDEAERRMGCHVDRRLEAAVTNN